MRRQKAVGYATHPTVSVVTVRPRRAVRPPMPCRACAAANAILRYHRGMSKEDEPEPRCPQCQGATDLSMGPAGCPSADRGDLAQSLAAALAIRMLERRPQFRGFRLQRLDPGCSLSQLSAETGDLVHQYGFSRCHHLRPHLACAIGLLPRETRLTDLLERASDEADDGQSYAPRRARGEEA
jgi:hypothetical protein